MTASGSICPRMFRRFVTSRSRHVTFLLAFVVSWFLLTVLYLQHSSTTPSENPDARIMVNEKQESSRILSSENFRSADDTQAVQQKSPDDAHVKPENNAWDNSTDFQVLEKEFAERRELYEKICKSHTQSQGGVGGPGMVYYYEPNKLSVCHTPKVGCTFWKRAFHFLYNETGGKPVKSLYEIDRFYVHFGGMGKVKAAGYNGKQKAIIDNTNKVLFTRDPYARLWSAYVDKFILPDSWLDHGRAIMRRRKDPKKRRNCPDNLEFTEFLDYALNANHDVHWNPLYRVCNPCQFHPQYVGKLETFNRDTTHILRRVGLEYLVQGHNDHSHHVEDEIRTLTKYTFRLHETRPGLRQCLTHAGVAERLWMAFVLNGYINENMTFPTSVMDRELNNLKTAEASEKAVDLLLNAHLEGPARTSSQMRAYKRGVLVQHYRAAPPHLLQKMVDYFNLDFLLFDYEPKPADIFS